MEIEIVFVAVAALLQVIMGAPPVEVSQSKMTVLEKQMMTAVCRVGRPISYCRFYLPQIGGFNLSPSIPPERGIEYYGAGLDRGECGIRISNVRKEHNGPITCHLAYPTESQESTGQIELVVAQPPMTPKLNIKPGIRGLYFEEGEKIQADCRIEGGRPVANISWFLGSEPITEGLSSPNYETGPGDLKTVSQSLTLPVKYTDHGKDLRCVANHIALGPSNINHSIHRLNINFPPKPKSSETEQFGFTIGQPGKVIVMFNANPKPNIHWEVGTERLTEGMKDSTRSFEALVLQNKGSGTWAAVLNIAKVTASDVEKKYTLVAENELGREAYKVAISTSPAPPADITAGAIAGIVVAVLVILLIIFILIFARAFGKWCFAAGTNGNKSSSEVAIEDGTDEKRPPSIHGKDGVYSSTEYINGNDKKWSKPRRQARESNHEIANIGSLTYKNYKPVETEDGKKIYVSPEDEKKILLASKMSESVEVVDENERKLNRRGSRSSDSSYEIPVQSKPASEVREGTEDKEAGQYLGQAVQTQNVARHTFPFYGRKRRLFPETHESKKVTGEEAEQFLKLPPHIEQINGEDGNGDGPRRNFKFSRLFRKDKSSRGSEEKGEDIVEVASDPPDQHDPTNVEIENTQRFQEKSEKRDRMRRPGFNSLEHSAKRNNSRAEGNREGSGKLKDRAINFKTIFGIEGEHGASMKKDLLLRDVSENATKETEDEAGAAEDAEEFSGGIEETEEDKRASLKFPVSIPPRGRWGPRSRRHETKSTPEMHIDVGEDVPPGLWKKNKKKRPASVVDEGTALDLRSDTESADHGSTDKSSVSKLTEEKQQKRFIEQLLDTIKRKNKDKMADNDAMRNLSVTMDKDLEQQIQKDQFQKDHLKTDGIVYAELDMTRSPGNVVRRDDEKTEYAEIIHPKTNEFQRGRDELKKSRENLSGSREHLTEGEGTTLTPDGKKEAAV